MNQVENFCKILKYFSFLAEGESSKFSFANPVYSPTATNPAPMAEGEPSSGSPSTLRTPRPSYKVEDVVTESPGRPTTWKTFKRMFIMQTSM